MDPSKVAELRSNYFSKVKSLTTGLENITSYLKAMKVEFQTDLIVDGIQIDLAIPQQNIFIKVAQTKDINFDKQSFTGKIHLYKRLYQLLQTEKDSKVIVLNFLEFIGLADNQAKVNFLISEGIKSNVENGKYDFSETKSNNKDSSSSSSNSSETSDSDAEIDEAVVEEPK